MKQCWLPPLCQRLHLHLQASTKCFECCYFTAQGHHNGAETLPWSWHSDTAAYWAAPCDSAVLLCFLAAVPCCNPKGSNSIAPASPRLKPQLPVGHSLPSHQVCWSSPLQSYTSDLESEKIQANSPHQSHPNSSGGAFLNGNTSSILQMSSWDERKMGMS